jgi:hypothetical protein
LRDPKQNGNLCCATPRDWKGHVVATDPKELQTSCDVSKRLSRAPNMAPTIRSAMHAVDFAKWRDAFLLVSGLAYVFGYGVWAVVAWQRDLGSLPVIEGQYFAAGIPVIIFLFDCTLATHLCVSIGRTVGIRQFGRNNWYVFVAGSGPLFFPHLHS